MIDLNTTALNAEAAIGLDTLRQSLSGIQSESFERWLDALTALQINAFIDAPPEKLRECQLRAKLLIALYDAVKYGSSTGHVF